MQYIPTYQTVQITGYKKQFSPEEGEGEVFRPQQSTTSNFTLGTEPEFDMPQEEEEVKTPDIVLEGDSYDQKKDFAVKYLAKNLDLTDYQAAAIAGVFDAESSFNLNAENLSEKSGKNSSVKSSQYGIGIGQWTHDRHDDFVNYIKSHGGNADLQTQLDFAIDEINNKYPDFLVNLRLSKNLRDACAYVYTQYTAAQYKNIRNNDELYSAVDKVQNSYRKKHQELYGKSGMGDLSVRINRAAKILKETSLKAYNGIRLPELLTNAGFKF